MAKNRSAADGGTSFNRAERRNIELNRVNDGTPRQRQAIRAKQVLEIYPVSEAQLYKEIAEGLFPQGFILTPGGRCRAWWRHQVEELVEARAAASREGK